jgi:hypothetical protein
VLTLDESEQAGSVRLAHLKVESNKTTAVPELSVDDRHSAPWLANHKRR